jgi:integrase
MKNYVITPEDFMSRKERQQLMKICKEHSELDLIKGRQTWPIRYMLVDLALYSGLRVSEMAALKVGDLVFNESDPFVIVRHGKGNKKRTVYIDQKLAKHLKEFIHYKERALNQSVDLETPLFTGRNGKHSPPITLMKSFKQAIEASGLPSRYSIHKARHTYTHRIELKGESLRKTRVKLKEIETLN